MARKIIIVETKNIMSVAENQVVGYFTSGKT